MGEQGWGSSYLGVVHYNGPGDFESTWYTHVDYPNDAIYWDPQEYRYRPWDTAYAQGDFVSRLGNKGTSVCHLHFYVADGNDRGYPSMNVWMSGVSPSTGYDLQHLSDDEMTGHASNNTGAGYGRLYTGTCSDPLYGPGQLCRDKGPENEPKSWAIRTLARNAAAFAVDTGSTRAAIQGPCGANRRWVKGCYFNWGVYRYTQSLVVNFLGLEFPQSITEGYPDGTAYRVTKAMWKAYGRSCGGDRTYLWIGRPIGEEYQIGTYMYEQDFERGYLIADRSNPANQVYVAVRDDSGNLLCTIGAPGVGGLYDWLDFATEPCYDVDGGGHVTNLDVLAVVKRDGTSETNPINATYPGLNYDDLYDITRNGVINTIPDAHLVALQWVAGRVCR
jgi:hypothetical protein